MSALTLAPKMTISMMRCALTKVFRAQNLDTPALDARVLISHALGLDHTGLIAQADRVLTREESDRIGALAERRLAREPVARIVAAKEFWGLVLHINDSVLVPRPDTETVVEAALAGIDAAGERERPLRIADLGVGSGAILLALLSELPNARGIGTDRSPQALAVARGNAARLGLAARADFVACDYGAALEGSFDLIVSNPPYVVRSEIAALAPEVALFEPRLALDGGEDGLEAYRTLAADARRLLTPGGRLVVEVGMGQAEVVTALLTAAGLAADGVPRRDLAGIPRAVCAVNP